MATSDLLAGRARLDAVIRDCTDCIVDLIALLEAEREALCSADVERIDACAAEKIACIERLEQLDRQRIDISAQVDTETGDDDGTAAAHDEFRQALQRCQEANATNGQLTRLRRRHVERALQVLSATGDDTEVVYGPTGKDDRPTATTKTIGCA